MIPARDFKEYSLFPKEDLHFISKWLRWTDEHISYLENTVPIATLDMANLGSVDGTAAMASSDEGFLFLFNPNLVSINQNKSSMNGSVNEMEETNTGFQLFTLARTRAHRTSMCTCLHMNHI